MKNIAAEIGDDLVFTISSTDSSVRTQKDVKRPDFIIPQPQGSPEYRAHKPSNTITEKIAHFVPKSLKVSPEFARFASLFLFILSSFYVFTHTK